MLFQYDETLKERVLSKGQFYIRRLKTGNYRLAQLITPIIVFTLAKGKIDGCGSNNWSLNIIRRSTTNL